MALELSAPVKLTFTDINAVQELGEQDTACLNELRDVLLRHNQLDRFGICLLHSHFPMADDEILLEETDAANRTLTIRPVKRTYINPADIIETNWTLGSGAALQACTKKSHLQPEGVQAIQADTNQPYITPEIRVSPSGPAEARAIQACTKKSH